jgi:putative PIN family toxin of toxin-antitoxin system
MKVIFDTNVVVSAALRDRVPEEIILFVVEHPDFEWIGSPAIVAEYVEVLARPKFRLPETIIRRWNDIFDRVITIIDVTSEVDFPRDPKDAKFLACALAANADYLVTGDKDFEEAKKIGATTVLSVHQFKSLICDVWDASVPPDDQAKQEE